MRKSRSKKGSALSEFGPALGLLLIGFVFPMFNFLVLFGAYSSCMMLNSAQCREAAMLSPLEAGAAAGLVRKQIPDYWRNHGLGLFAAVKELPTTVVTYNGSTPEIVHVQTTCTVRPWLPVPLPIKVPGMNADTTFKIDGYAPTER